MTPIVMLHIFTNEPSFTLHQVDGCVRVWTIHVLYKTIGANVV